MWGGEGVCVCVCIGMCVGVSRGLKGGLWEDTLCLGHSGVLCAMCAVIPRMRVFRFSHVRFHASCVVGSLAHAHSWLHGS